MLFVSYYWTDGPKSKVYPTGWGFSNLVDDFNAPQTRDDIDAIATAIRDARFPGRDISIYILNWKVL